MVRKLNKRMQIRVGLVSFTACQTLWGYLMHKLILKIMVSVINNIYMHTHIYIYIYIVINREIVLFYHNSSVLLDMRNASS